MKEENDMIRKQENKLYSSDYSWFQQKILMSSIPLEDLTLYALKGVQNLSQ